MYRKLLRDFQGQVNVFKEVQRDFKEQSATQVQASLPLSFCRCLALACDLCVCVCVHLKAALVPAVVYVARGHNPFPLPPHPPLLPPSSHQIRAAKRDRTVSNAGASEDQPLLGPSGGGRQQQYDVIDSGMAPVCGLRLPGWEAVAGWLGSSCGSM